MATLLGPLLEAFELHEEQSGLEHDRVAFMRYAGGALHRKPIDPDPWQERVLRSNAKQKILNTGRQVGKSTVIAGLALHKALYTSNALVLLFAPTEKQAKEVFAKVSRFFLAMTGDRSRLQVRRTGLTAEAVKVMGLGLPNGSRIEAMPATHHSARGFTADLVIIDEAAYATDVFYDGILPSIAVSEGDLVLASTPNGKRGFFYEEWTSGTNWYKEEIPSIDCPRIDNEFINTKRRQRGERHFQQEFNCQFVETEDQVFSHILVERSLERGRQIVPLFETNGH